ncbi:MAG: VOC family protein [Oligoflexales bacterium]
MLKIQPNHVAILVRSVRKSAQYLSQFGFEIGEEEIWDGEGTREIYVERSRSNSLLLMEPIRPGAYQRALDKRGPGLHHLAIDVPDVLAFVDSLAGSGWLLHLSSLKSLSRVQTIYLARPGVPTLIEVSQRDSIEDRPRFVQRISIDWDANILRLMESVGLGDIVKSGQGDLTALVLGDHTVTLKDLLQ